MAKKQAIDNETLQAPVAEQIVVAANDILVDPVRNLRHFAPNAKDIEDLARNIVDRGQIQPVGIRARPESNGDGLPYELLFGFRRVLAIQYANDHLDAPDLKVVARLLTASDVDAMMLNLDENLRRKELSLMDVSLAISRFKEQGLGGAEIAAKFGKGTSWVSQIGKFTNFRPAIQKQIHDGKLDQTHARELIGLEDEAQDALLADFEKGKLSGKEMNAARKAKKKGKRDKRGRKENKAPSIKAVVNVFDDLAQVPKDEKTGKAVKLSVEQEWRRKVALIVSRFLKGEIGAGSVGKLIERIS